MLATVEQYLSGIDIALLENAVPAVDSVEDILALINAKDEREAIGGMYQTLSLLELLVNRLLQHVIITFYNSARIVSSERGIGERPVNPFFESVAQTVQELTQGYQQAVVNSASGAGKKSEPVEDKEKERLIAELAESRESLARAERLIEESLGNEEKKPEQSTFGIQTDGFDASKVTQKKSYGNEELLRIEAVIKESSKDEQARENERLKVLVSDLDEKLKKEKDAHEQARILLDQHGVEIKTLNEQLSRIKSSIGQ